MEKIKSIVSSSFAFVLSYFVIFVIQTVNTESAQILMRFLIALIIAAGVLGYYGYKSLAEKIEELKKYVQ